jgi:stearoyl-CoA desaturase (delta-9 desaturase)
MTAIEAPAEKPAKKEPFRHVSRPDWQVLMVRVFVFGPILVTFGLAIPLAAVFGWFSWHDLVLGIALYFISTRGIGTGFHRRETHGSFKPKRALRIALVIAGSMAIEGGVFSWVADHRRHHKYSDIEGDPHSPWRFGDDWRALLKGMYYAHMGWLFSDEETNQQVFIPDLLKDRDARWLHAWFPAFAVGGLLLPAVVGGFWGGSWHYALTAFIWAGIVRMMMVHHVTWSVNSICHTAGTRPFRPAANKKDKASNVWWLSILTGGESWHNVHHADTTLARHGVRLVERHGQYVLKNLPDGNARLIWLFWKLGWLDPGTTPNWPTVEGMVKRQAELAA